MPFDVGGLETDRVSTNLHSKLTDGATIFVGGHHRLAKASITRQLC